MSNGPQKARLVLVDDHPAVLHQAVQLLSQRFEVVATLNDPCEATKAVSELQPDILVLDITLPSVCGIELARRLHAAGNHTRIVFLTAHADPDYLCEALEAGALGYVIKPRMASDLVPALDAALGGKRFVSPCPELAGFI